jgi:hypothetical protein
VVVLAAISVPAVVGLMALGVVVATFGHATRSRFTVAVGLAVLFIATGAMIVGAFASYNSGGSADCTGVNSPQVPC